MKIKLKFLTYEDKSDNVKVVHLKVYLNTKLAYSIDKKKNDFEKEA